MQAGAEVEASCASHTTKGFEPLKPGPSVRADSTGWNVGACALCAGDDSGHQGGQAATRTPLAGLELVGDSPAPPAECIEKVRVLFRDSLILIPSPL